MHLSRDITGAQKVDDVCGFKSCDKNADTSGLLNSLLSSLGEELGLDDEWDLWKDSLAKNLEETLLYK